MTCAHVSPLDECDGITECPYNCPPVVRGRRPAGGHLERLAVVALLLFSLAFPLVCLHLGQQWRCDRLTASGSVVLMDRYGCQR